VFFLLAFLCFQEGHDFFYEDYTICTKLKKEKPYKESSITRQFEGVVFILFAASKNLEYHHISRSETRKYENLEYQR